MDKWVPHELNKNHKRECVEISSAFLLRNQNDPFFCRILTCDKKWILYDNHKCSVQWLDVYKVPQDLPKGKFHQKKAKVTVW